MSKVKSPSTTDEGYYVDIISDDPSVPPQIVQTHLRHLLLAVELGDLVLLECERKSDDKATYIVCASVVNSRNKRALLPICELPDTADLLTCFRPPVAAENGFVKPTHTGNYSVCLLSDPDEVALAEVSGESTH